MTDTILKCSDVDKLPQVAEQILQQFPNDKIFLLSGKMGAGKTTMIKSICQALKVIDNVSSPTFSIVNEYKTEKGSSVYHFDLYRIKSPVELMDIGFEEYIYSSNVCLIEWPELAADLMPASYVKINIETEEPDGIRIFQVSAVRQ